GDFRLQADAAWELADLGAPLTAARVMVGACRARGTALAEAELREAARLLGQVGQPDLEARLSAAAASARPRLPHLPERLAVEPPLVGAASGESDDELGAFRWTGACVETRVEDLGGAARLTLRY